MNPGDRGDLHRFYDLSHGVATNHRDASNAWKGPPTTITPGENRPDRTLRQHKVPTISPYPGKAVSNLVSIDPYSRSRMGTNLNNSRRSAGNPVATVMAFSSPSEPERKRPRMDLGPRTTTGRGGQSTHSGHPDVIILEDDEDLGKPLPPYISSSPDPLSFIGQDSSPLGHAVKPHPFDDESRTVPDGLSTQHLRQKIAKNSQPLNIEDSDDTVGPPGRDGVSELDRRPLGHIPTTINRISVKDKVKQIEFKQIESKPEQRITHSMKANTAKSRNGRGQQDAGATSTTPYEGNSLPVEAWYLGLKRFPERDDCDPCSYSLQWKGSTLWIRQGQTGLARYRAEFNVERVVSAQHSQASHLGSIVLQLRIGSNFRRRPDPVSLTAYPNQFKPASSGPEGCVTVKFHVPDHALQFFTNYATFLTWLGKHVLDKSSVDHNGGKAIWEGAERAMECPLPAQKPKRGGRKPVPVKSKHFPTSGNIEVTTKKPSQYRARSKSLSPDYPAVVECDPQPTPVYSRIETRLKTASKISSGNSTRSEDVQEIDRPRSKSCSSPPPSREPTAARSDVAGRSSRSRSKSINDDPEKNIPEILHRRRRSARRSAGQMSPVTVSPDPDELILVFPPDSPGAVSITNADLKRLQPGEFLNDTLIEFGLKLWLSDLRERDPQLAESIHVFSSFFYKKLNTKNAEEGYQSVRKWTAKTDIFSKKYIIVPINERLHWYLAIIYQPEHVLQPPPKSPQSTMSTRRRTASNQESPRKPSSNGKSAVQEEVIASESPLLAHVEDEVEELVYSKFERACSISQDDPRPDWRKEPLSESISPVGEPETMIVDVNGTDLIDLSEAAKSPARTRAIRPRQESRGDSTEPETVCSDSGSAIGAEDTKAHRYKRKVHVEQAEDDIIMQDAPKADRGVSPTRFYSTSTKKRKRESGARSPPLDIEDEAEVDKLLRVDSDETPRTYIFTLDSLGSRHPQAVRILANYLMLEATNKRGIVEPTGATGKHALVPVQPNYCDCGIYLLHLAETFISDPTRYFRTITSKSMSTISERRAEWKDEDIGCLREKLSARILELSKQWKIEKAAKEEQRKKEIAEGKDAEPVESSDSEIDIVEDLATTKPRPPSSKRKNRAQRIR